MFGPRLNRIFASRWSALWWAGGMLLLAWQVASSNEGAPAKSAAGQPAANPWAVGSR